MKHKLNGKNVLVTGAMGLVGGHLTEKLIGLGANNIAKPADRYRQIVCFRVHSGDQVGA